VLFGKLSSGLRDFASRAQRELKWDASRAAWIRDYLQYVEPLPWRMLAQRFLDCSKRRGAEAREPSQKRVYGDANDYNVLVACGPGEAARIAGVIDFGDTHYGITVSELATAAAYAILGKKMCSLPRLRLSRDITRNFP